MKLSVLLYLRFSYLINYVQMFTQPSILFSSVSIKRFKIPKDTHQIQNYTLVTKTKDNPEEKDY